MYINSNVNIFTFLCLYPGCCYQESQTHTEGGGSWGQTCLTAPSLCFTVIGK